jgi:DNA invertase Pin-like site-specific DNA recombinase
MLSNLRQGDIVVVWKLDRLGRSLKNLVELVNNFMTAGVGLQSLNDFIDTTTHQGRLIFNVFASLAEFERELIRERTKAGLNAARARGRLGGKPKGLSKDAQAIACAAETLYLDGKLGVNQIIKQLGIAKTTFYNYLRWRNVPIGAYTKK